MTEAENTDRELWRENDDHYSPSIHVTEDGAIGMSIGGNVIVLPIRQWHKLAITWMNQPMKRDKP